MLKLLFRSARSRYHVIAATSVLLLLTGCQAGLITTPAPAAMATPATPVTTAIDPLPLDEALPPVQLNIPDLALALTVSPMGWVVEETDGERTTHWEVPEDVAGWHITSAGAGGAGRVVLSGHQAAGAAPFALLAQGEVQPGQEISLTDSAGSVFIYRITEVSDPIPLTGATPEDEALASSYLEATTEPLLTLITGWPDFTTTHRVFVVAELAGAQR